MKFSQKVVCGVLKNGNAPPIVHIRENSQQWKQAENDETVGPDMNKRTKRNFTLIELLVVMLLMGVLMTLMLPAFKRMISGNQVQQLASNLKLGLEQAQSHAITSRRYVALILPNPTMGKNDEYALGGYRMAYVEKKKKKKTVEWHFADWVPDTVWKEGVDEAKLLLVLNAEQDGYNDFKEGEPLDVKDKLADIELSGLIDIQEYKENDSATPQRAKECAIIFSPYGGFVGDPAKKNDEKAFYGNLRLAVAEALQSGSNFIYPSRNASANKPTNYLVLEINRFSGRVKYYQP